MENCFLRLLSNIKVCKIAPPKPLHIHIYRVRERGRGEERGRVCKRQFTQRNQLSANSVMGPSGMIMQMVPPTFYFKVRASLSYLNKNWFIGNNYQRRLQTVKFHLRSACHRTFRIISNQLLYFNFRKYQWGLCVLAMPNLDTLNYELCLFPTKFQLHCLTLPSFKVAFIRIKYTSQFKHFMDGRSTRLIQLVVFVGCVNLCFLYTALLSTIYQNYKSSRIHYISWV